MKTNPTAISVPPRLCGDEKRVFACVPARPKPLRRSGFTLMEVNIALLIVGVGLMGVMALFPVGLRQGDSASSDTTQAAFADLVLNAMRANAQMVTNWNTATDPNQRWVNLTNGVALGVGSSAPTTAGSLVYAAGTATPIIGNGSPQTINDYLVPGQYIQYELHLEAENPSDPLVIKAWMRISTRKYTELSRAPYYATSFIYMGM